MMASESGGAGATSTWGADVMLAVAFVAWANGRLDAREADAIVSAAIDAGIDFEEVGVLDDRIREPVELEILRLPTMPRGERRLLYGAAYWVGLVDGPITDAEQARLDALAERVGVPDRDRAKAESTVRALLDAGHASAFEPLDLGRLRKALA